MDVMPWPKGQGFKGADTWWDYVRNQDEEHRLENLLGLALLDPEICTSLINGRDLELMEAFGLSPETQHWLCSIQADDLAQFAQAIIAQRKTHTTSA